MDTRNNTKGNLKGTDRTLDGFEGDHNIYSHQDMKLEDGLLSTDGWTLIDDSKNFLFDNSEWAWVKEREHKDGQDWYFMAYGHDYKAALKILLYLPVKYLFHPVMHSVIGGQDIGATQTKKCAN